MPLSHHPTTELLWSYAVGNLEPASAVVVATHLALCPKCRRETATMEATAGEMFESIDAAPVDNGALERLMARVDGEGASAAVRPPPPARPINPPYPRPLRDYLDQGEPSAWRRLADGVEAADVNISNGGRRVRLLRVQPGRRLPRHGHGGDELTLVLAGGYRNENGAFARGDVECADQSVIHEPVADLGDPCICLTATRGPMVPTAVLSWIAQRISRLWS